MQGYLDSINKEEISGWIIGSPEELDFALAVDGEIQHKFERRYFKRPDVQESYPLIDAWGFKILTPSFINDGRAHKISITCNGIDLEGSPKVFRYVNKKILFIHIPKTGGTTTENMLRQHKSVNGVSHIEYLNFTPESGFSKDEWKALSFKDRFLLNRKFRLDNKLNDDLSWISGHVQPSKVKEILNKHLYNKLNINFCNKSPYKKFSFDKKIYQFEVFSLVRNPIDQLISQLNWFNEIYKGRHPEFMYQHNIRDLGYLSFYISHIEKNTPSLLSQIINLNALNAQCKYIAPNLIFNPTEVLAKSYIRQYKYIGINENMDGFMRKILYPEFKSLIPIDNKTGNKLIKYEELDPYLKNFIYKKLKPDFILYEEIKNYFI